LTVTRKEQTEGRGATPRNYSGSQERRGGAGQKKHQEIPSPALGELVNVEIQASAGTSDLFVLAPQHIAAREKQANPLQLGCGVVQHIVSRSPAPVIVFLPKEQLAEWRDAYSQAGADAVLGLPFYPNALAEVLKGCIQGHGGTRPS
jgi:hypothetical protein